MSGVLLPHRVQLLEEDVRALKGVSKVSQPIEMDLELHRRVQDLENRVRMLSSRVRKMRTQVGR